MISPGYLAQLVVSSGATSTAISADIAGEKPVFIVQDSTGGFWLMGVEGYELSDQTRGYTRCFGLGEAKCEALSKDALSTRLGAALVHSGPKCPASHPRNCSVVGSLVDWKRSNTRFEVRT